MREKIKEQSSRIKPVCITLGIGFLVSLVVILVAAWGVSSGRITPDTMPAAAAIACGVGAFVTGMGGAALFRKNSLIAGITSGLAYFLLIYLLGTIVYFRTLPVSPVVGMLFAALGGGLLAGLFGKRKRKKLSH